MSNFSAYNAYLQITTEVTVIYFEDNCYLCILFQLLFCICIQGADSIIHKFCLHPVSFP